MWNAPSDRDYYGDYDAPEPEDYCIYCGAGETQPCEEHCLYNLPAEEPAELHVAADTEYAKEIA